MRPTEIAPLPGGPRPGSLTSDRLTQVLIWVAFFLVAAVVALGADFWLWPGSADGPVAEAVGLTLPARTPTFTPSALSTALPTPAATWPSMVPTEVVSLGPATPPPCVPPDDWSIHIVQEGNTLYSLARRYGTDVDALMDVNCLNTHTIFIGQRLYVPGPPATPTIPTPVASSTAVPLPTNTPRFGASATPAVEMGAAATPLPTLAPSSPPGAIVSGQYLNIVLLGSDRRPGSGAWRTDSMIVVSVDTQNNVVRLLSIPRDLWVNIPGHGYNRINTADLWGELAKKGSGPDRVKQTIYQNLGIPIHYYVRVDFQGFIEIINTVGGVDVDVDCPLPDIDLSAGMHHMNGQEALRYARSRKSTNDFDRGRRQRKVLLALWDQALTLDIIPKLPQLWQTMNNTFQTDLPLDQVINLAYVGAQLEPQRIISRAIGPSQVQSWVTPEGAAVLLPREDAIRTLLDNLFAPVNTSQLDVAEKVRVEVLNGSRRREAEQLAAAALRWDGFKVVSAGTAERQDYALTSIFVYTGDKAAGERLARQLRVPLDAVQDLSGVQEQPDPANPVDIQVILGQNYDPCQR
jgi:LCP family protein required for cell wall assembly